MSLKIPSNHPDGDFYKYCADSLGFEPSDEFSDGESKAEITEGGWRCHLQRMVKIYDGGSDRINYFRDRNTKDGTRKSYTLSEHFSNVDEGNQPQGPSVESQTIREDAVSSEGVVAGPEPIYKLYRTFKDPRSSKYSDPHGSEEQQRLMKRSPSYYLEIRSPLILRLLCNLVPFYPCTDLNGASVRIPEPYMLLWHHHTALRCFLQKDSNDEDTKKHLRVLLEFLDSNESDAKEFKALDQAPRGTGVISYRNAWYLYRPGCWVSRWDPALSTTVLRVIKSVEAASKPGLKLAPVFDGLTIRYRGLSSEGTISAWLKEKSEDIKENQFSAKVSELRVMPLEYAQNQEEILRVAGQRGLKYWQLTGQCLQEFVGSRTDDTPDESYRVMIDEETRNRKWRESHRVIDDWETPNRKLGLRGVEVDKHSEETDAIVTVHGSISGIDTDEEMRNDSGSDSMGNRHKGVSQIFGLNRNLEIKHPGLGYLVKSKTLRSQPWLRMYEWVAPDVKGKPDSVTSMFYDFEVWGFSFRHKEWHQYHVNDLEDVNYRKKSFDHLVLNKDYKDILKAMVAHHVYKVETRFKDLVAGKGQGLVILLHGPPGVGKTLTAECIAYLYERPLYSVTSGDIGVDPDVVEKKLLEIFDYAITWNAVLLLDEADVFLAERSLEDLTRNALVSVFLRNLEYFNGILFLTTNRVGTIDEAFQSRIHVTLGIDPFSPKDRREVWYNFIKDIKELSKDDRRVLASEAKVSWCHKDMNGRQIRNCVKTALVLAREEGVPIGVRHFQTVINIGLNFSSYMDRLKKMNRERLAEAIGTRLDLRRKVPRAAPTNNRRRVDVSRREDSEHGFEEGQEESDLGSDL